jgi:hypothetical protein
VPNSNLHALNRSLSLYSTTNTSSQDMKDLPLTPMSAFMRCATAKFDFGFSNQSSSDKVLFPGFDLGSLKKYRDVNKENYDTNNTPECKKNLQNYMVNFSNFFQQKKLIFKIEHYRYKGNYK